MLSLPSSGIPSKSMPLPAPACTQEVQCDKKTRDHDDPMDPCSECRHFGGPGCKCTFARNRSQNDMLYSIMLESSIRDYGLPEFKAREEPRKDGRVPSPMPDHEIKPNWTGAFRDQLLTIPDVLPPQVRRCPRAYLVPPGESITKRKRRDWHASHPPSGNITSSAMSFASSLGPMQHMMVSMPQPSAIPLHIPIISTTVHWPTLQAMPVYYPSQTVISPSMPGYPVAHAMSSAVSCLHFLLKSYDTDRSTVGCSVNCPT